MLRNPAKTDNKKQMKTEWKCQRRRERRRERERERRLVGHRGGGGPRSSGTQGAHRQWGNNDMKEPSWRSHAALAHLRRHKISWPLHTHTHMNIHVCMQTHTLADTQKNKDTHTVGNRECSRRLYNKEKSVTSRTSKHSDHHSSAYTDWPLVPPWTKNTMLYKQEVETHWLVTLLWQFNHTLLKNRINNLEMMALEPGCLSCTVIETCYFYWQRFHISLGEI